MSRKVRRYTHEFKQQAVNLDLKSPNVTKTASELGIPSGTLHTWIEQLKVKSKTNNQPSHNTPDVAALIEENRRLHKELAVAKEEKEILKKAAAYFAQHLK